MEQNSGILNALIVEKNVMFYLLFFIVLVAGALHLERANHLRRAEDARNREMLKGNRRVELQISGIFLGQSAIIGIIGGAAGFGLGMLALTYRNAFSHFMKRMTALNCSQRRSMAR